MINKTDYYRLRVVWVMRNMTAWSTRIYYKPIKRAVINEIIWEFYDH